MTKVNWDKPIEYNCYGGGWVPARVVCKDRRHDGGYTHIVLYKCGNEEGCTPIRPDSGCLRNVAEKKKFWTVTLKYVQSGNLWSATYVDAPHSQYNSVGSRFGAGLAEFEVINIVEGEYEV